MDYVVWPGSFQPSVFEIGLRSHVAVTSSTYTGQVQTQELPGSRWLVRVILPQNVGPDTQAEIEAFFAKVRGQANRIQMWHLKRPVPRGTLRGTPTLGSAAAQGGKTLVIAGSGGSTLLAGDMLGITVASGVQVVQVVSASGTGTITAEVSPPLKAAANAGSAVYWSQPMINFIVTNPEVMVPYGAGGVNPGVAIDLTEV